MNSETTNIHFSPSARHFQSLIKIDKNACVNVCFNKKKPFGVHYKNKENIKMCKASEFMKNRMKIRFSSFLSLIEFSISILDTVDITTGQVLTPAPGAKVVTIKDSNIIWQVFEEMIWIVSLRKVWEELKNYQLPWKELSIKQCLINFVLAVVMLYLSNFDVYSDINVAHDYIAGATYFYGLSNDSYGVYYHLNCIVNNDTIQYNEFTTIYGWVSFTPFRFLFVLPVLL